MTGATMYVSGKVVTVLGHSTALSGHLVSSINPRVIILGNGSVMAFQRGVQKVEVITAARNKPTLNFYLFAFEQACNQSKEGCAAGDLYTPGLERDWLSVSVADDVDLANTPQDCLQCHQRQREMATLLMRELNNPWTHFFEPLLEELETLVRPGVRGRDLMMDYRQGGGRALRQFRARTARPERSFALETAWASTTRILRRSADRERTLAYDLRPLRRRARPSPTGKQAGTRSSAASSWPCPTSNRAPRTRTSSLN